MLPIVGKTAGPNVLNFLGLLMGGRGVFKVIKFSNIFCSTGNAWFLSILFQDLFKLWAPNSGNIPKLI